jgi:3-dehydroquinate dehydratase/shikimate dehydrogenase
MICISIAQESRRLALADMLNAGRQCDLLEVRLDRFGKAPDVGELLSAKKKPIIFSCRRPQDGGDWEGSEEERLAILRQCIISKADYVEIELDVADQIRKFPPAKRVISYTNLRETPADIADIYARAQTKSPDVIKLVTPARTPEEAWPLVQILAKPPVPTVVVGLGKPGIMLTVLGKKIGAPWTYAALERGMEAYPGQATISDLEAIYHYGAIARPTRFIGVTGFSEREEASIGVLNAALAHLGLLARCLPLGVGSTRLFRKIIEAVKLAAVVVDADHQRTFLEIASDLDPAAQQSNSVDLILHKDSQWHGHNTFCQAAIAALQAVLQARTPSDKPLQGRMFVITGHNAMARMVGQALKERGAVLILASHDRAAVQKLAGELECRHILFEALYSTMHDVLIVCDHELGTKGRAGDAGVHPGYLKSNMTVMDLTATLQKSTLLREAERRGCAIVSPRQMLLDQLATQVRLITGKEVPLGVLAQALPEMVEDEE